MRILIVSYYYPPLNSVASRRPFGIAEGFRKAGHEVTVLTARKPRGVVDNQSGNWTLPGVRVIEVSSTLLDQFYRFFKIGTSSTPSEQNEDPSSSVLMKWLKKFRIRRGIFFLGRMPDILDLWVSTALKSISGQKWDVVISTYAPYACLTIGRRLKHIDPNIFWISDFRDPWSDHHNFSGLFPFTLVEKYLEHRVLVESDLVTTVSQELVSRLQKRTQVPVELLSNGFYERREPIESIIDDKIRLVYTGTLYPNNANYQTFIDALLYLRTNRLEIFRRIQVDVYGRDLAGFGMNMSGVGLEASCCFHGEVSYERSLQIQQDSSALLFFDLDSFTGVTTGKLFEYISSGVPVLRFGGSSNSSPLRLINETNTGSDCGTSITVSSANIEAIADGTYCYRPNTDVVEKYSWPHISKQLVAKVESKLATASR